MKLKHLFYLNFILLVPSVLIALFKPSIMLSGSGLPADNPALLQMLGNTGGLLTFLGLIAWFAARVEDSPLRRNIRLSFFTMNLVMTVIHAVAYLNGGAMTPLILHGILTLAYGYFQFIKPDA